MRKGAVERAMSASVRPSPLACSPYLALPLGPIPQPWGTLTQTPHNLGQSWDAIPRWPFPEERHGIKKESKR